MRTTGLTLSKQFIDKESPHRLNIALRSLAVAAHDLAMDFQAGSACSQSLQREFLYLLRARLGENYSAEQAGEDFALSVAATAVILKSWDGHKIERRNSALELVSRCPLCRLVTQFILENRETPSPKNSPQASLDVAVTSLAACLSNSNPQDNVIYQGASTTGSVQFFEHLLAEFDVRKRREMGVYFTPQPLAEFVVQRTHTALQEQLGIEGGLAADSSQCETPLHVLDPAMGSGAFLIEVVRRVRQEYFARNQTQPHWNDYVSQSLLPHLHGVEIIPAAYLTAHLLLAMELAAGGFQPRSDDCLQLHLADALARPDAAWMRNNGYFGPLLGEQERQSACPIIIGNPPYRGASSARHHWISELLYGRGPSGAKVASYFHVQGEPLGERKVWLHDDYVKFFRLAQWQVEQTGKGIVALVTNHGFLDNPTFRGMRAALLQTFSHLETIDLHGNTKKEAAKGDESLFDTAQGMAITLAVCSPDSKANGSVLRGDLIGSRSKKFRQLRDDLKEGKEATRLDLAKIRPRPPHYFFHACHDDTTPQWNAAFRLPDAMPLSTTAIVTARDRFIVDIHRDALLQRLREFSDLRISDEEIRSRYFQRTRSALYTAGDTRGWKLSEARKIMAAQPDWESRLRRCWYRPFDQRWILWTNSMIDWPRETVMRHLTRPNLAIVGRRQMVRGRPCNFFWIADDLVLDGYIRSDNRGSESVFPLFLAADTTGNGHAPVNFSKEFVDACQRVLNAKFMWEPASKHLKSTKKKTASFGPYDLLHYIYALFHSPEYRRRYSETLYVDFPRVLLPGTWKVFQALANCGEKLIAAHLLKHPLAVESPILFHTTTQRKHGNSPSSFSPACRADAAPDDQCQTMVAAGFPKFTNGQVHISAVAYFSGISQQNWDFKVGAHQTLKKWLKDRRKTMLTQEDLITYQQLCNAVSLTRRTMQQIDDSIENAGGWPDAFATSDTVK